MVRDPKDVSRQCLAQRRNVARGLCKCGRKPKSDRKTCEVCLKRARGGAERKIKNKRWRKRVPLSSADEKKMLDLYAAGYSFVEIGPMFGVLGQRVFDVLRKHGAKTRPPNAAGVAAKYQLFIDAASLLLNGKVAKQAARKMKITHHQFILLLRRNGVKVSKSASRG